MSIEYAFDLNEPLYQFTDHYQRVKKYGLTVKEATIAFLTGKIEFSDRLAGNVNPDDYADQNYNINLDGFQETHIDLDSIYDLFYQDGIVTFSDIKTYARDYLTKDIYDHLIIETNGLEK